MMEDKLKEALEKTGIPFFHIRHPQVEQEYIVYKYSESSESFSDDEEDVTSYLIYLNLFCQTEFGKKKKAIKKYMKECGFIKKDIPAPYMVRETREINQSFIYSYIEKAQD